MSDRLLKIKQVESKVSFGKTKIYEMIKKGDFPKPIKIENNARWKESLIDQWIKNLDENYDQTG